MTYDAAAVAGAQEQVGLRVALTLALGLGERLGGGIVECGTRACDVAALRAGRRDRDDERARPRAWRVRAARAARGPGRLAQRRVHARRRRDRLLAAEDRGRRERAGRYSRRPEQATRTRSHACSSSRTAASCTRTATACSARSTTPRTRCRTRCCAPGAGSGRFEGRSSLRSWLYRIATNACLRADRAPAAARAADRLRPAGRPARRARRRRSIESVWVEPYPDDGDEPGRRPRPATSGARASSSRSSPRCSICPRGSARC